MSALSILCPVLAYPDWGAPGNDFGAFLLVAFGFGIFASIAMIAVVVLIAASAKRKGNPQSRQDARS